jgi:hypothetical protein
MSGGPVNIEFSHVYSSEGFTEEHAKSVDILKELSRRMNFEQCVSAHAVLVDDRTKNPVISLSEIVSTITSRGASIDWIALESKLEESALHFLNSFLRSFVRRTFNKKQRCFDEYCEVQGERIRLVKDADDKRKPTCALVSATWALARLGLITLPREALLQLGRQPFAGSRNITILHKKFFSVEQKALAIIGLSPFSEARSRIEYRFYS